jgi:hypothetical protein
LKKYIVIVKDEDNRDESKDYEFIEIVGEVDVYREGDYLVISPKELLN